MALKWSNLEIKFLQVSNWWLFADYSKSTISSLVAMDHEKINYDLLVAILEWIVAGEHEVRVRLGHLFCQEVPILDSECW